MDYSDNTVEIVEHARTCDRLDTSYTCRCGSLRADMEQTELRGIVYVSTAAELYGEVACLDNSYDIAVLLAEERHCSELPRLFDRHLRACDLDSLEYLLVYELLNAFKLLGSHCGEVGEVKAELVVRYELTRLLNVRSEHLTKRRLEKVSRRVVSHDALSACGVYLCLDGSAGACHALYDLRLMKDDSVVVFLCVYDLGCEVTAGDNAGIAYLSAALCVEGRSVENEYDLVTLVGGVCSLLVLYYGAHLSVACKFGVARELRCSYVGKVSRIAYPCVCACVLAGCSCALLLFCEKLTEFILVYREAAVGCDLLCEVYGEAERIGKLECVFAGDDLLVCAVHDIFKKVHALLNGLVEVLLLDLDKLCDELLLLAKLGVSALVFLDNGGAYFIKERLVYAEDPAVACGTSEKTSENVASALV